MSPLVSIFAKLIEMKYDKTENFLAKEIERERERERESVSRDAKCFDYNRFFWTLVLVSVVRKCDHFC